LAEAEAAARRPSISSDSWSETQSLPTRKAYRRGTHRTVLPSQTIARVEPHRSALGITRLANVTGLDYLGIPVFMAIRPNSRAISVSQGKGLDEDCAIASALMEAAEVALAERPDRSIRRSSFAHLSKHQNVVDAALLPRMKGSVFRRDREIEWVEGHDLATGQPVFVPFDVVHTDFTRPSSGTFVQSSNGLASGNHLLEALIAGLCEVIERDAAALFAARPIEERAARRVRLEGVRAADGRQILDRLEGQSMSVAVWDMTTDIGVACFACSLSEAIGNDRSALGTFRGAGCHLDRSVALTRAITEAAQSRLTYIAGSRDDLYRRKYRQMNSRTVFDLVFDRWEQSLAASSFASVPSLAADTLEEDIDILLERLHAVGLEQAIGVDLTDARTGIPVVRTVVPGLELEDEQGRFRPGPRLRALRKRSLQ
jgi:YcaO-like protein with predicted kinase domain